MDSPEVIEAVTGPGHLPCSFVLQQMKDAVEAEKSLCNDVDGFLLCVISVGGCGQIRGVDGEKISIDELTANFVNCPSLKGKPKIVIIETCQEGNEKCPNGTYAFLIDRMRKQRFLISCVKQFWSP